MAQEKVIGLQKGLAEISGAMDRNNKWNKPHRAIRIDPADIRVVKKKKAGKIKKDQVRRDG